MSFTQLGLAASLQRAVAEQGYTSPTPVQEKAIPVILSGEDVLVSAQTGTGKTAGFTLPLLHQLSAEPRPRHRSIRALILVPTRELALQVEQSVVRYSQYLPLKSTVIFGGVSMGAQVDKLRRGVDIVVATPGRLLDHVHQQTINLSQVQKLVLDEADRMLDMGFLQDMRKILAQLPSQRQSLMFSATFSEPIRKLAGEFLQTPHEIQVSQPSSIADSISQQVLWVDQKRKREMLAHMIGMRNWRQVLVFTRTKHGANRLAEQLQKDGLNSTAIHGNKSQAARTRALNQFKEGKVRVLVATDVAARGLDISKLFYVVNYDLPQVPEDYVHRIGRTGRAGMEGQAVSLVAPEEKGLLSSIERFIKCKIPQQVLAGYEPEVAEKPQPRSFPHKGPQLRVQDGPQKNSRSRRRNPSKQAAVQK